MTVRKIAWVIVPLFFLLGIVLSYVESHHVPTFKSDSLYEMIKQKKTEYELKAENAKIDSVWQKTPGINGRKVNVKSSYMKMKEKGEFDPELLVYDKVEPKIKMDDLPPSPVFRGHPDKNMVALLINVSWGEEYIPSMIKSLSEENIKANFFIDGAFARDYTHLVQMIEEEGHVIGSHGYGHKDMSTLSKSQTKNNLEMADEFLFALTKEKVKYFAPPSGSFTTSTVEAAYEMGMDTILWTVDTIDWKNPTKEVLINRVMGRIHNGATILMHPTAVTAESLPSLIQAIKKEKYRIGSLPSLLSTER